MGFIIRWNHPERGILSPSEFLPMIEGTDLEIGIGNDPEAVAKLAPSYSNPALGEVRILKDGKSTLFDVGEWKSTVASRKNDDGTISFITVDPTISGFEFVVADRDGQRRLVTRDAQHEYLFVEEGTSAKP